jgi:5-methylcytosine-specific restriction endonuclease McrA
MSEAPIPNRNGGGRAIDSRRDTPGRRTKRKVYASARWAKFRKVLLAKRPLCETPECPNLASHVDHKSDDESQWTWRPADFNCLCPSCHTRKTVRDFR